MKTFQLLLAALACLFVLCFQKAVCMPSQQRLSIIGRQTVSASLETITPLNTNHSAKVAYVDLVSKINNTNSAHMSFSFYFFKPEQELKRNWFFIGEGRCFQKLDLVALLPNQGIVYYGAGLSVNQGTRASVRATTVCKTCGEYILSSGVAQDKGIYGPPPPPYSSIGPKVVAYDTTQYKYVTTALYSDPLWNLFVVFFHIDCVYSAYHSGCQIEIDVELCQL